MHPPHHRSLKTPHPRWPATSSAGHTPRPEYPRPSLRRRDWVNLNGEWDFGAGPARRFDRRIVVPFAPQSALSGIGDWDEADIVWYRRRFDVARAPALLLHFGAVDHRATIWVNGEEVARHEGGHTPFSGDIAAVATGAANEPIGRADARDGGKRRP